MLAIREERTGDRDAIARVHCAAFPTTAEAALVEHLRDARAVYASIVALSDELIVGHALFSHAHLTFESSSLAIGALGPVAVLSDWQRRGVGGALIRAGLERSSQLGMPAVSVLGDPGYYRRFGFRRASTWKHSLRARCAARSLQDRVVIQAGPWTCDGEVPSGVQRCIIVRIGTMTPRLALLISLAGFGCSSVDVEDIRRHQRQWHDADIQDYVFVSYRGCFCGPTDIDGIRHEVRDGDVVASVGVSTGLPLDHEAQTIDDIFDEALASAREDPDEFRITYDATHGFIQSVAIDPDSSAEDDGFILEVRCFSTDVEDGCPVTTLSEAECAAADGTPTDVAESDPWQTCEYEYPGPIGRITETDQVCCTEGP